MLCIQQITLYESEHNIHLKYFTNKIRHCILRKNGDTFLNASGSSIKKNSSNMICSHSVHIEILLVVALGKIIFFMIRTGNIGVLLTTLPFLMSDVPTHYVKLSSTNMQVLLNQQVTHQTSGLKLWKILQDHRLKSPWVQCNLSFFQKG